MFKTDFVGTYSSKQNDGEPPQRPQRPQRPQQPQLLQQQQQEQQDQEELPPVNDEVYSTYRPKLLEKILSRL